MSGEKYLLIGISAPNRDVKWDGSNYNLVIPLSEDMKKEIGANATLIVNKIPNTINEDGYKVNMYICEKPKGKKLDKYNVSDYCVPVFEAENDIERKIFEKYYGDEVAKALKESVKSPLTEETIKESMVDHYQLMSMYGGIEGEEGYIFDEYLKKLKEEYKLSDEDIDFLDKMFEYETTPEIEAETEDYILSEAEWSMDLFKKIEDFDSALEVLFDGGIGLPYDQLETVVVAIEDEDLSSAIHGTCKRLKLHMDELKERFGDKLAEKIYEDLCVTKVAWE